MAIFLPSPCGPARVAPPGAATSRTPSTSCWLSCLWSRDQCKTCCGEHPDGEKEKGEDGGEEAEAGEEAGEEAEDGDTVVVVEESLVAFITWQANRNASSCLARCTTFTAREVYRILEEPGLDADGVQRLAEAVSKAADDGDAEFWKTAIVAGRPVSLAKLCDDHVHC